MPSFELDAMGAVFMASDTYRQYPAYLTYVLDSIVDNLIAEDHCLVFNAYFEYYLGIMLSDFGFTWQKMLFESNDKSGLTFSQIKVQLTKEDAYTFRRSMNLVFIAKCVDSRPPFSAITVAITDIAIKSGSCMKPGLHFA